MTPDNIRDTDTHDVQDETEVTPFDFTVAEDSIAEDTNDADRAIDTEADSEIASAKEAFDADDVAANEATAEARNADGQTTTDPQDVSDVAAITDGDTAIDSNTAVDNAAIDNAADDDDDEKLVELAQPYVGQWNTLISTTNWEKGRIIADWRAALIESGAESSQYSDEAWTRRVGGVTAPHVGRLRRVHERFATTFESYQGLYWSHFLAALDWEDAPLWLEGASKEGWSVAGMREQRWQALGAVESNRPTGSQVIEVDTDEDIVLPAQGGGSTKEYGDEPGVASGPTYEGPDFGEEDELMSLGGSGKEQGGEAISMVDPDAPAAPVQPFAGLPELPDDLADSVESFKLAILRHKTSGWNEVSADTIDKYLKAFIVLLST
ncbi:hypothetical protein N9N28_05500 [Rubripirellula amarantea]|nr:hypothetical protein [Rubripirellula amarantea]